MWKNNRIQKIVVLVVVLLAPPIIFVFFSIGRSHIKTLPYYGPKKAITKTVNGKTITDTAYYTIPYYKFTDQNGDIITQDSMMGHVYVAEFFFATCPTVCPKMAVMLRDLEAKFYKNKNFRILSHTVNPQHDSVAVLKKYSEKVHAGANWYFVTGPVKDIYKVALKGYFVGVGRDSVAPGGFLHTTQVILVDKKGHIRGYFDAASMSGINKLADAIKVLYFDNFIPRNKHKSDGI